MQMPIQTALLGLVMLATPSMPVESSASDRNENCMKPYSANPRYWQYEGKPVLLLGGSKTDHLFLLDDLESHLDEIVKAGGNYVRNTMSQREGLDLKPHRRRDDGKFDLEQWNPEYWARFANCLMWCDERDIIIQIEVWDRFDYSQEQWQESPWRPANNVNYTNAETGLADVYPAPAHRDRQPFFYTVPGMSRYHAKLDRVRRHQERFVEKMLSYSLAYGNVLYCMNNETSTPPRWGQYWMEFIRKRADQAEVEIYATDMFDDGWKPHVSDKVKLAIANPKIYPFIDISQVNSRNFKQDHWDRFNWVVRQLATHPRPLNHTKIYSDGETNWGSGTPKDGVERFWRNLIGGAASCRFHRPTGGIGLNEIAQSCIRSARLAETLVEFWDVTPRMDLLEQRDTNEAYLAAQPGERYLLYFTDGGEVALDLRQAVGPFRLKWIEVSAGRWGGQEKHMGGKLATIRAPGQGGWVAAITKSGS